MGLVARWHPSLESGGGTCCMVYKCFEIEDIFYMLVRFSCSQPLGMAHSHGHAVGTTVTTVI